MQAMSDSATRIGWRSTSISAAATSAEPAKRYRRSVLVIRRSDDLLGMRSGAYPGSVVPAKAGTQWRSVHLGVIPAHADVIPAHADVIPAHAGIHRQRCQRRWVPAFAGTT